MTTPGLPRDDLAAALQARRELGPDYDAAFAESLAERVDQTIQARLAAARAVPSADPGRREAYERANAAGERKVTTAIACVSLGVSIPLSGIAAGMHSLAALVIIWTGIVLVNLANALRRRT
ncbi:MAG TPA: hypothetical protein VFU43_29190 [Streptosporangiaceae bacterium]|nr:hypothetical protein [Streptosporangiaceae bacterium]